MSVFISYKREDAEAATRIAEALRRAGHKVWFDGNLTPGSGWIGEVDRNLRSARAIVVCWSKLSVKSENVLGEAKIAHERGVLVPVFLERDVSLPPPFNMLQTEQLAGWDGQAASEMWNKIESRVSGKMDEGGSLSEAVAAIRARRERGLENLLATLDGVARDLSQQSGAAAGGPNIDLAGAPAALKDIRDRLRGEVFQLFVVGRMKTGKSTLINSLLGPADAQETRAAPEGPLPVDRVPCTAVLTRLRYADKPYVDAIPKNLDEPRERWTFDEYHKRARIRTEDGKKNEALFDRIREFEVGWPSPLLRSGVTLVDSPGVSEKPERTALTYEAVRGADAAIIVYRSEPFAGEDEIKFANDVVSFAAGGIFTLVNLRDGRPLDASMEGEIRDKLNVGETDSLIEKGIYAADLQGAIRGRFRGDSQQVDSSGLLEFERRLGRFLMSERYQAHLRKVFGDIDRESASMESKIKQGIGALRADSELVASAVADCREIVEDIGKRRLKIRDRLKVAQQQVEDRAVTSFSIMIESLAAALPGEVADRPIPGLDGIVDAIKAGTYKQNEYAQRAIDIHVEIIERRLKAWSDNPADKPGLTRDIQPLFEQLVDDIEYETKAIDRQLATMQRRLDEIDPSFSSGNPRSAAEDVASHVIGVALFGALGPVLAVGGWRGVAGGVAGLAVGAVVLKIAALVTIGVFHVVLAPAIIIGAIVTAIFGGGALAASHKIADRLKNEAAKHIIPQVRALAADQAKLTQIRSNVSAWFVEARRNVDKSMSELIQREHEHLDQLETLSNQKRDKEKTLAVLTEQTGRIEAARVGLAALSVEIEQA